MFNQLINRTLIILMCFWTVAISNNARAYEASISYCAKTSTSASIDEALACEFSEKYISPSLAFSKRIKWLKVDVSNSDEVKEFTLKLEPFLLNKINVFYQTDGTWKHVTTGASQAINPELVLIGGYRVLVPAAKATTSTYYVAVESPALSFMTLEIAPWPSHISSIKNNLNIGLGIQLGLLLTILGFALVSYLLNKSVVMERFSLSVVNLLLCLLLGSGIIMQTLLPSHPALNEFLFHSALYIRVALWVWVTQALLETYKTPAWYDKSCQTIYMVVALAILFDTISRFSFSSALIGVVMFLAPIIQIYAVKNTNEIPDSFRKVLIAGFALSLGLFALMIINLLYPSAPNSRFPLYFSRLTDLATPLVILAIISYRNRLVHDELGEMRLALNEAKIRAEYESKLLSERQTLIDMLAHELKNPLTSISLAVDNLVDDSQSSGTSAQKRISNINRSIKDMDEIIERCNLMNNLDGKKLVLEQSRVNLRDFFQQLAADLDDHERILIESESNVNIVTDPKFLKVTFSNLIQNALKYSVANSKIQVIIKDAQNQTKIQIQNEVTLQMIPDEQQIFERFYRHPLAQKYRGAGLGLYLTREMCRLLGGRIEYSHQTKTVSFMVELPHQI